MTDIFKSQIFMTGTKFKVADNSVDGTFGPGTTGTVAYVKGRDQDFDNVLYYRSVITRRGKSGKERLEIADISTPVFDMDNENVAKMMPDEKRRYYVHIEPIATADNILELSDIDFLAYGFAYAKWIRKLNTRAKHVNAWPNDASNLLNSFVRMNEFYDEDPEYALDNYSRPEVREDFIQRIRIMESTLVKCSLSYMTKVAEIEKRAVRGIMGLSKPVGEKGQLKATYNFFDNKVSSLSALMSSKGSKSVSKGLLKAASAGISWS